MAENVIVFKVPLFNQLIAAIRAGSVEEITRIYFEMYPAEKQPNEGSTKPTYSELEAENLRLRWLLQRIVDSDYMDDEGRCMVCRWKKHDKHCPIALAEEEPPFRPSSSLVSQGAESVSDNPLIPQSQARSRHILGSKTLLINLDFYRLSFQRKISKHSRLPEIPSTQRQAELANGLRGKFGKS